MLMLMLMLIRSTSISSVSITISCFKYIRQYIMIKFRFCFLLVVIEWGGFCYFLLSQWCFLPTTTNREGCFVVSCIDLHYAIRCVSFVYANKSMIGPILFLVSIIYFQDCCSRQHQLSKSIRRHRIRTAIASAVPFSTFLLTMLLLILFDYWYSSDLCVATVLASRQVKSSLGSIKHHVRSVTSIIFIWSILSLLTASSRIQATTSHDSFGKVLW